MFYTIGCGTPFTGVLKKDSDGVDIYSFRENTFCYCLHPSPVPCFMCCGVGPCAMAPRMKKTSATKLEGTGESVCAARACAVCFHDKGDVMEYSAEQGHWIMKPGNSPAYPPCLHNTTMGYMKVLQKGGVPQNAEMER